MSQKLVFNFFSIENPIDITNFWLEYSAWSEIIEKNEIVRISDWTLVRNFWAYLFFSHFENTLNLKN